MGICDWFDLVEPIQATDIDGEDTPVTLIAVYIESDIEYGDLEAHVKGLRDSTGRTYSEQENDNHFGINLSDIDADTMDQIQEATKEACDDRPGCL